MRILAAVMLVATAAWGGERLLGTMIVSDGGSTTNRCTGTPFTVNSLSKLSIQCDSTAYVLTDVAGCDGGTCIVVAAAQFLTTSVNQTKTLTCHSLNPDGGVVTGLPVTYNGGWVAMGAPAAAAAAPVTCRVYERKGDE